MKKAKTRSINSELLYVCIALIYAVFSLYVNMGSFKALSVVICLAAALLLILKSGSKMKERLTAQSASLGIYVLIVALSLIWATANKLFLNEFAKLLIAFSIYIIISLRFDKSESFIRRVAAAVSACCALYALFSVDMATLKLSLPLLSLKGDINVAFFGFETGTRLTGIFGNGNILAGVLSIGIFMSLYLLESADTKGRRVFACVTLSMCAYTFVMAFSMGASGFFVIAVIIYIIASGEARARTIVRMLDAAIPSLIFVFLSFRYYEAAGAALCIPLLSLVLNALAVTALELFAFPSMAKLLTEKRKLLSVVVVAVVVVVAAYAAAALTLTGAYPMEAGAYLRRSAYPDGGEYSLLVDSTGALNVNIESQNSSETVMHTSTMIYNGPVEDCQFTVPEDSLVVYFNFHAEDSCVINSAELSDGTSIKLDYKLLPSFISNRMQGLWANENAIQRTTFFADGMKLFRRDPLLGNSMGSFESLIYGYQDFYYMTKYVHNHYIQVLLDNGIPGLLSYLALLLFSIAALIKNRKKTAPHRALYPAACACLTMICLHSIMEVVMSSSAFLVLAYAVFALISLCWGKPLCVKPNRKLSGIVFRWAATAILVVYALLISLNMYAGKLVADNTTNVTDFYGALNTALKIDVFDAADYKLSYVVNSIGTGSRYRATADEYAAELTQRESNSTHYYLIRYYLELAEYENAILAAEKGIVYNRANPDIWNMDISAFDPYMEHETVKNGVVGLYEMLLEYNEELMNPIGLTEMSASVFNRAFGYQ